MNTHSILAVTEPFNSYKTFVDVGIPLVAAFFGAIMGGAFALVAGMQAHRNNLQLDRIQKQQHINGVLSAISSELTILVDFYSEQSGASLANLEGDETYTTYFSLRQQYFIVYPNNTDVVGQIQDQDLVKAIVYTYNIGNFLIESFVINNWYIDRWKELQGRASELPANYAAEFKGKHIQHTALLKELHKKLHRETERLLIKMYAYQTAHPTK